MEDTYSLDLLDIHFRDSPDSLNGLGIPGNIWLRRFTVTYTSDCERREARAPKASSRSAEKLLSQFTLRPYELYMLCKDLKIKNRNMLTRSS